MADQTREGRSDRYFTTNDQPSAEDLDDMRCYLAGPKQEFDLVNRGIEELERGPTFLRTKRETLHGVHRSTAEYVHFFTDYPRISSPKCSSSVYPKAAILSSVSPTHPFS